MRPASITQVRLENGSAVSLSTSSILTRISSSPARRALIRALRSSERANCRLKYTTATITIPIRSKAARTPPTIAPIWDLLQCTNNAPFVNRNRALNKWSKSGRPHYHVHVHWTLPVCLATLIRSWCHSGNLLVRPSIKVTGHHSKQSSKIHDFSAFSCLQCFDAVGWAAGRASSLYKNFEWCSTGMVICLERDADLHMAQLMPLPLTVSCFSKIQTGFTFLVPAHPGSPEKGPLNVCVCVCAKYMISCWPMTMTYDLRCQFPASYGYHPYT